MDTGYLIDKVVGSGTFGMVYLAQEKDTNEKVALKKVFQDRRYKNREHLIMEELNHPCIVKLRKAFFTKGEEQRDVYLNLVMEYIPETLSTSIRNVRRAKQNFSQKLIKVFAYQMVRALAYLKVIKICHRDLKPQNVLIDPFSYKLKICDFGSAKKLELGQANIAYICSRFYRAPELILGKTDYDTSVDMWSLGCIIAEMQLLEPIFPGQNAQDQLVQIIRILGTPGQQQIQEMLLNQDIQNMPQINGKNLTQIFNKADPQFIDLIQKILNYSPKQRIQPIDALLHPYFDEIRKQGFEIEGKIPQDLFNFTNEELQITDDVRQRLIPGWYNK